MILLSQVIGYLTQDVMNMVCSRGSKHVHNPWQCSALGRTINIFECYACVKHL